MTDLLDITNAEYAKCKTYDDWRRLGYQVKEGEKAYGFVDGKAVFQRSQTKKARYRRRKWAVSVRTPFFSWNSDEHPRDPWSIADQCDCDIPF
jgi:hypothetical protein